MASAIQISKAKNKLNQSNSYLLYEMKMDAPTHSFYENETLPATADYSEKLFVSFVSRLLE